MLNKRKPAKGAAKKLKSAWGGVVNRYTNSSAQKAASKAGKAKASKARQLAGSNISDREREKIMYGLGVGMSDADKKLRAQRQRRKSPARAKRKLR